jgi:hypothetical protein
MRITNPMKPLDKPDMTPGRTPMEHPPLEQQIEIPISEIPLEVPIEPSPKEIPDLSDKI